MRLPGVVSRRAVSYVVYLYTGDVDSGGRITENNQLQTTKTLAIFPLTFQDLRNLPDGQYTTEDIKIYEVGTPTIPTESVVKYNGKSYRVMMVSDRNKDGGFSMYVAKKTGDLETDTE